MSRFWAVLMTYLLIICRVSIKEKGNVYHSNKFDLWLLNLSIFLLSDNPLLAQSNWNFNSQNCQKKPTLTQSAAFSRSGKKGEKVWTHSWQTQSIPSAHNRSSYKLSWKIEFLSGFMWINSIIIKFLILKTNLGSDSKFS